MFVRALIAICLAITLCAYRLPTINDILEPWRLHKTGVEVDGPPLEVRKATRCSANERGQERCSGNSVQECVKESGGNHYVWKNKSGCGNAEACECWTIEDCRCAPKLQPSGLFVQDGF